MILKARDGNEDIVLLEKNIAHDRIALQNKIKELVKCDGANKCIWIKEFRYEFILYKKLVTNNSFLLGTFAL